MNDTKGILLWAGLLIICGIIFFLSRRMKKQIEENGIETNGVISRITDEGGQDEIGKRISGHGLSCFLCPCGQRRKDDWRLIAKRWAQRKRPENV